jgi:hypothetical protein
VGLAGCPRKHSGLTTHAPKNPSTQQSTNPAKLHFGCAKKSSSRLPSRAQMKETPPECRQSRRLTTLSRPKTFMASSCVTDPAKTAHKFRPASMRMPTRITNIAPCSRSANQRQAPLSAFAFNTQTAINAYLFLIQQPQTTCQKAAHLDRFVRKSVSQLRKPASFLTIRVHDLSVQPGLTGLCVGYEQKHWRASEFARHIIEWLPEFALNHSELADINSGICHLQGESGRHCTSRSSHPSRSSREHPLCPILKEI